MIKVLTFCFVGNDTSNACANVNDEGKWNRWGCDWDYLSIICKLTPSSK